MGDMIRCPKCATHHYRNDPCPDEEPRKRVRTQEQIATTPLPGDTFEVDDTQTMHRVIAVCEDHIWAKQYGKGYYVQALPVWHAWASSREKFIVLKHGSHATDAETIRRMTGYVSDLRRQVEVLIAERKFPDPLLLATIGCMSKELGLCR